jgi:hypothetical protein
MELETTRPQEVTTTRAEPGQDVARGIAERGADREWICSLLDRVIGAGQNEMYQRIVRTLGPFVAETTTQPQGCVERLETNCHLPYKARDVSGMP